MYYSRDIIIMTILILVYCSIYLRGILQGTIHPVFSTRLLFSVAVLLSFLTTLAEHGRAGMQHNLYNLIDGAYVIVLTLLMLFSKKINKSFLPFEKKLLVATCGLGLFWLLSLRSLHSSLTFVIFNKAITLSNNSIAHLLVQIILLIAYIPLIKKLRSAQYDTESLSMRGLNAISAFLGAYQPRLHHAVLPLIFTLRAAFSTLLVCLLLLRIRYKQNAKKNSCISAL